jgi:hypothetical protein
LSGILAMNERHIEISNAHEDTRISSSRVTTIEWFWEFCSDGLKVLHTNVIHHSSITMDVHISR